MALRAVTSLDGRVFLRATRDGDYVQLSDYLEKVALTEAVEIDLNVTDNSGRVSCRGQV